MEDTQYGGHAAGKIAKIKKLIENATLTGEKMGLLYALRRRIKRDKIKVRSYQNYIRKKLKLQIIDTQVMLTLFGSAIQQSAIMSQPIPRFAEGGNYGDPGRRGIVENDTSEEIVNKWRQSHPNIHNNGSEKNSMEL